MADNYDRNRRRRRRDYGRQDDDHYYYENTESAPAPAVNKPMRILGLKTRSETTERTTVGDISTTNDSSASSDKSAVVVLSSDNKSNKKYDENESPERSRKNISTSNDEPLSAKTIESSSPLTTQSKRQTSASTVGNIISGVIDQGAQTQNKLAPPLERQSKTKLIDDSFQWCDTGLELMLDQSDFAVVGIVGLQGCGKSTLLSLLAGNMHQDAYRNYFFYPQTKETKEEGLYQTLGVDMFVTSERMIILDSQPLLSAAVMDCHLRYERKFPSEYSSLQNYIEMQSMQILTFMLSVCNIVLVADDFFLDINFLKFIQDAEMLKPSPQPPPSSETTSSKDDGNEFYPTVIFLHNKATKEDFKPQTYNTMQHTLHQVFSQSKLKIRGNINMLNKAHGDAIIQDVSGAETNDKVTSVNLLMLPLMEFYKSEPDCLQTTLPEYRGYPSFNTLLNFYRAQVLSAPRAALTHNNLTEKTWYHFAARMWESVKKSSLLAEYNRLL